MAKPFFKNTKFPKSIGYIHLSVSTLIPKITPLSIRSLLYGLVSKQYTLVVPNYTRMWRDIMFEGNQPCFKSLFMEISKFEGQFITFIITRQQKF